MPLIMSNVCYFQINDGASEVKWFRSVPPPSHDFQGSRDGGGGVDSVNFCCCVDISKKYEFRVREIVVVWKGDGKFRVRYDLYEKISGPKVLVRLSRAVIVVLGDTAAYRTLSLTRYDGACRNVDIGWFFYLSTLIFFVNFGFCMYFFFYIFLELIVLNL